MKKYNYLMNVQADVEQYITDNNIQISDYESREDLEQYLNDTLWNEDSVTGNASGSYTFSRYKAEENIAHNLDILSDVVYEFGGNMSSYIADPELADVSIRCYVLGEAISKVLDDMEAVRVWELQHA